MMKSSVLTLFHFKRSAAGVSLIELGAMMTIVAIMLIPLINNRAQTLKAGNAIKLATTNLIYINNLMESATATGQIQMPGQVIDLNTFQPGESRTTTIAQYNANSANTFWYRWIIRDTSYRIDTNGSLEKDASGNPILVSPQGTRIFSASLQVFNTQPTNSSNPLIPNDTFNTTLRTNTGVQTLAQKVGIQFLFDNSDSMSERVLPGLPPQGYWGADPTNDDLDYQDAAYTYHYPGDPDWTEYQMNPSLPNHKGNTVDVSSRTAHYNTSLAGEMEQLYKQEVAKGLGYEIKNNGMNRIGYPHLTYRYQYVGGAQNFPAAYNLSASEQLNPFNNDQLDLTFQKRYPGASPNHTYPAPGVLGMPSTGSPGAPDANPATWDVAATSRFFRIYDVLGVTTGYTNTQCSGEGVCGCQSLVSWMSKGFTLAMPAGFKFDTATGKYVGFNSNYTDPNAAPFNIFKNVNTHCMLLPSIPPFLPVDGRRHITEVATKNPNDADFDDFVTKHLIRMEMARNGALKFLVGLEQYPEITDTGLLGFKVFNHMGNDSISLNNGAATSKYASLHPNQPKLFEDLRIMLLGIERYGAPNGAIVPFGETPIYNRLQEAGQELVANPDITTRFVVMFTDGKPTDSNGQADPALPGQIKQMLSTNYNVPGKAITLFNVGIVGSDASQLKSWSAETPGGATFYAGDQNQLDASFAQVVVLIQREILLNKINRYNLGLI